MDYQNVILDAINEVLTWDLPDDALAAAFNIQASFMAKADPETSLAFRSD